MSADDGGRGPVREAPPFVLVGSGHLVRASEIVAVFRFQSGQGSQAVRDMITNVMKSHTENGLGPRVWDISGHRKRRSAVVLRNGEIVLSQLGSRAILRRMNS